MAGKPKAQTEGSGENWGGKRAGAGRPKTEKAYSAKMLRDVNRWVKKRERETGKSFGEILTGVIWEKGVRPTTLHAFAKILIDMMTVKSSPAVAEEKGNGRLIRPTVFLPETMAVPDE